MKVAVFGAGTMGSGIAQVFAAKGHTALMYASSVASAQRHKDKLAASLNKKVAKGKMNQEAADDLMSRVLVEEFEAAAVPRMLADVDLAVINSNYALQAGVDVVGTAIGPESPDVAYPNIIAIREGDDREELKTLVEVLQSDAIVNFIKDTYGTAVVPTK